jgi:hypothetical protein
MSDTNEVGTFPCPKCGIAARLTRVLYFRRYGGELWEGVCDIHGFVKKEMGR